MKKKSKIVGKTANEKHLIRAAQEYRRRSGFSPINYTNSINQPFEERIEALQQDVRWLRDYVDECVRFTESYLDEIDLDK